MFHTKCITSYFIIHDFSQTILEEKFLAEMENSKKCAEIESQLILERNLKMSLEIEKQNLSSINQMLKERIRSLEDLEAENKSLTIKINSLIKEKTELSNDLELLQRTSKEVAH